MVSQEQEFRAECEAAFDLLMRRYGERFTPQDTSNLQPLPSGLLGPVRLIVGRK